MADNRRQMTIEEKEELAKLIAEAVNAKQPPVECHAFTGEEREAIRDIVRVKKKAIQTTFWIIGAIFLWIGKEIWMFIYTHLSFGWPGK